MAIDTKALALQVEAMQTIYNSPGEVVAKLCELLRLYFRAIDADSNPSLASTHVEPTLLALENTVRIIVGATLRG